ncbi:MAG: stage II sporulation protein D [Thermacetogeniaceae bacterium]|jgi:stage II sporulation protein D|nr:stage II sporulation protein D [Thermoanaerobacterales bacterium]NLN21575.1 stage II sporulation protein D [Syntrophomonadaceae bacterium]
MAVKFGRYRWLGYMIVVLTMVVIGIPALLVRGCSWESREPVKEDGVQVKLQISEKEIISLPLEQYLIGVVAAEMPVSFHEEALKAQAVAARTYSLLRMVREKEDDQHPDAHLCADPGHCQAWISNEEMRKRWGWNYRPNYQKISSAVLATGGKVLTHEGQLIDPVYHSSCGGRGTEDAREVWGHEVLYLKSVACTYDSPEKQKPVNTQMSLQELFTQLKISDQSIPVAAGSDLMEIQERTGSGRVKRVKVGSQVFSGVELRKRLGLRSTDFKVVCTGEKVLFSTRGYGHAVGMCQYGANGLAQRGAKYDQILSHYYQGTELKTIPDK